MEERYLNERIDALELSVEEMSTLVAAAQRQMAASRAESVHDNAEESAAEAAAFIESLQAQLEATSARAQRLQQLLDRYDLSCAVICLLTVWCFMQCAFAQSAAAGGGQHACGEFASSG